MGNIYEARGRQEYILDFPRHSFTYIAVPKNANTSVKHALLPIAPYPERATVNHKGAVSNIHIRQGGPFQYCRREEVAGARETILFVCRNPFARVASCYLDKICRETLFPGFSGYPFRPGMPFVDFLKELEQIEDRHADAHFRSQHSFYGTDELTPNRIIPMENLQDEWDRLRSALRENTGVALDPIPALNKKSKGEWRAIFNPEAIARVERRYGMDLETFGYRFSDELPLGYQRER